jgi:hypothetical protein
MPATDPGDTRFIIGSPSHTISSRFAILRQPVTPAGRLPTLRHHNLLPQRLAGGEVVYNQELYLNEIRLARSAFGASFYVIPPGNVSIQRDVPARCVVSGDCIGRHPGMSPC